MNFKTNEELREIWESENFGEDDELFVFAFDRHDIYFRIYDIIKDTGKTKNIDELLRLYSKFMKDFISESEAEIKKFDDTQYFDKIFVPNEGSDYTFYRNTYTNQWWIEVEITVENVTKKEIISCSEKDYSQALNGEIPNKWWKYYKKFF